jgi:hypothetical protein
MFTATDLAEMNAAAAKDQASSFKDWEDAKWSYFDNLRDSLREYGFTDQHTVESAELLFWELVK